MQNPFYHELSFTWNWWYLVFAISVVAMFFIGFNSVSVNPRNGRICWVRYSERGWYILAVMIFVISYVQSFFPPERSKRILGRFKGVSGNVIGALLGTVTPFCACSVSRYRKLSSAPCSTPFLRIATVSARGCLSRFPNSR